MRNVWSLFCGGWGSWCLVWFLRVNSSQVTWVSVWCRQYKIDFGHAFLSATDMVSNHNFISYIQYFIFNTDMVSNHNYAHMSNIVYHIWYMMCHISFCNYKFYNLWIVHFWRQTPTQPGFDDSITAITDMIYDISFCNYRPSVDRHSLGCSLQLLLSFSSSLLCSSSFSYDWIYVMKTCSTFILI